jgi:NAD(P)H dehydrogenase (quinone)
MILVTGATGNLGRSTIDSLLKKGHPATNIVALIRDEKKAADLKNLGVEVRIGDYNNYEQLLAAFSGIDKLLLISATDLASRSKQQQNAVNAAKQAGVKHVLYTSLERKNDTETSPIAFLGKSHIETEKLLRGSGLTYTIFRNNLYLDALPMFFGEQVLTTGIFLPAGDVQSAFALRADMAEAIANVLTSDGHENKEYSLSNIQNVSIQEIAQYLTEIVGKEINYVNPPQDVYVDALTQAGVPAEFIGILAGFAEGIKQGEFAAETKDLETLLGRKPITAKQFLAQVYGS